MGIHRDLPFLTHSFPTRLSSDLLAIAGKRASLGDLTRKLQSIPGVIDGVVFQADAGSAGGVRRIAALAVAPGLDEAAILDALRRSIDPVFLPRPLRCVDRLPRNATGKLPQTALRALLDRSEEHTSELQSLMRISYAVFCLKKKKTK